MRVAGVSAVVLAIAQAFMPVARQAPNDAAANHHRKNESSGDKEQPSRLAPPITEEQHGRPDIESESDDQPQGDNKSSIDITEAAPMPEAWTLHDKISFYANLILAAGGVIGVITAVCTLRKLGRQTKAAEDAAIAARDSARAALFNARAVVNAERGWLTLHVERVKAEHFQVVAVNVGKTPACLWAIHGGPVEVKNGESLPLFPAYGCAKYLRIHPRILPPGVTRTIDEIFTGDLRGYFEGEPGMRLFYIGKVVYVDTIHAVSESGEPIHHESRWCYLLTGTDLPPMPEMCPPVYEEYT